MKYIENIKSIADLSPDYLGFIFYAHSKRNFIGKLPELPEHIKKTGVFVNEELGCCYFFTETASTSGSSITRRRICCLYPRAQVSHLK